MHLLPVFSNIADLESQRVGLLLGLFNLTTISEGIGFVLLAAGFHRLKALRKFGVLLFQGIHIGNFAA